MIDDSVPWKETLDRMADEVERRASQKRWTNRTGFLMERDVMIASFAMRKLLDTPGKISDEARGELVQVISHRLVGPQPDFWNRYEFWEMFDLDQWAAPVVRSGLCVSRRVPFRGCSGEHSRPG